MSWYIVVKTIKGHRYRYRQRTWRENGKMRTESVYLGPASAGPTSAPPSTLRAGDFNIPVGPGKGSVALSEPKRATGLASTPGHLRAGPFVIPVGGVRASAKPKRRRKSPRELPKNGDFSDPFWDTPATTTQLREQAQVYYSAYLEASERTNGGNVLHRLLSRSGRVESAQLADLKNQLDWYQAKARTWFDRELIYVKGRVVLKRAR